MKCGKLVEYESIWAGERHLACLEHTRLLHMIGESMGYQTNPVRVYLPNVFCQNEVSEVKPDESN